MSWAVELCVVLVDVVDEVVYMWVHITSHPPTYAMLLQHYQFVMMAHVFSLLWLLVVHVLAFPKCRVPR